MRPRILHSERCAAFAIVLGAVNSVALIVAVVVGSNRDSSLNGVLSSNVLRVGLTLDYAPYSLKCNGGTDRGVDVDLANALAASLDASLEIVQTTWSTLLDDAASNRFDIAMGGISITLPRLRSVAFSAAVWHGGKVLVARCGTSVLHQSVASLNVPFVEVVVNDGGTNAQFVRTQWPSARVLLVTQNDQWAALLDGRANVTVTDQVEARLQTQLNPGLCASSELLSHDAKAFLLPRQDDVAWKAYVDGWVAQTSASGGFTAAMQRWSGLCASVCGVGADCYTS